MSKCCLFVFLSTFAYIYDFVHLRCVITIPIFVQTNVISYYEIVELIMAGFENKLIFLSLRPFVA